RRRPVPGRHGTRPGGCGSAQHAASTPALVAPGPGQLTGRGDRTVRPAPARRAGTNGRPGARNGARPTPGPASRRLTARRPGWVGLALSGALARRAQERTGPKAGTMAPWYFFSMNCFTLSEVSSFASF